MDRLLLVLVLASGAVLAAWAIQRLRPAAAPTNLGATPEQLDRGDFVAPGAPWLIAVFSSLTCLACADVQRSVAAFEGRDVAVQDVEVGADGAMHSRYRIESVPTTLLADGTGTVRGAWVGPLSALDTAELSRLIQQD